VITGFFVYLLVVFRAITTMYYFLVPYFLLSQIETDVPFPRSYEAQMKLIQTEFFVIQFSLLGVCTFLGVRYCLPYRIDRFEAGYGYLEDAIARRNQFCAFIQGYTLLTGVTWWLFVHPESFVDQKRHHYVFLTLGIINSIQLFTFLLF